MENKRVVFFFPSNIFSGHEKMAIRILEKSPYRVSCILNKELVNCFTLKNEYWVYYSFFSLIKTLLKIRFVSRKVSIVLIAGSPYGFLLEKIIIKLFLFELIDYVPFPELKEMQDRFHHRLMPFLNKIFIDKRVLIDDWQIDFNPIKKCIIIKNIIGND